MENQATVKLQVNAMKGVVAKRRILEVDGNAHDLQLGENRIALSPGEHMLRAYMRAPIGNKICASKPMTVTLKANETVDLVYHMVGGAFSRQFRLEVMGQEASPPAPVPAWAWIFAVSCIAIPVVALGGAIPVALGVGGAGGCLSVARSEKLSTPARVGVCLAITVGCWAAFGLLIGAFMKN